jgi:glycosyltransferase involved in cell wall biosynthesis
MNCSGRYAADLISIAVYSGDAASVRLLSPMSWWAGPQESSGTWQGIPYKHIGSHFAEIEVARYMPRRRLTNLLSSYDVIQVVSGSPSFACVVFPLAKPKCLSVATTVMQDRSSALAKERGFRRVWRAGMTGLNMVLERKILRRMDHVFAQSAYTYRLLERFVPEDRLSMGPPGVDTSLFQPGRDGGKDYILSVARFSDARKNVRMLFRAYALVRDALLDAPRLVLAGTDGPTREDWAVASELGISDRVEFHNNPSPEDLAQLYREAALFVLASNEEGFGIVLLEAMASGIAVVSTRCGGPGSIVVEGQTGRLTPVGDHRAMAASLIDLLRDANKRQEMGKRGRQLSEERFSIEVAGRPYLQVYDRLLGIKAVDCALRVRPQHSWEKHENIV